MNSKNFFQSVIILAVVFLMSSCTQDEFINDIESNDKSTQVVQKDNFKILPLSDTQVRNTRYTANYQVEQVSSEFNIDRDEMQLEIPLPVGDFSFLKAYNVSTDNNVAILYVIQRKEQNVVVGLPTRFVAQDKLSLSELNINTKLLANNGCMRIYVMNNSEKDMMNDEDLILNCLTDSLDNYKCEDTYAYPAMCSQMNSNAKDGSKRPGVVMGGIIK